MVKEMKENNIFFNTFVLCNIAERVAECSNREVFDYVSMNYVLKTSTVVVTRYSNIGVSQKGTSNNTALIRYVHFNDSK